MKATCCWRDSGERRAPEVKHHHLSTWLFCICLACFFKRLNFFFWLTSYFKVNIFDLSHRAFHRLSSAHWSALNNAALCYLEQHICMIALGPSLCLCSISTLPPISHSSYFFFLWPLLYGTRLFMQLLEAGMLHCILGLCKYNRKGLMVTPDTSLMEAINNS